MNQIISFDEYGRPRSLRMPKGEGIDLRLCGTVKMTRISDVVLDEDTQDFKVEFRDPRFKNPPRQFTTYEGAVAAEVEIYRDTIKKV